MNRNLPPSKYIISLQIIFIALVLPMVALSQSFPFQLPELPAGKKITVYYNVVVNEPLDPVTTSVIGEHDTVYYAPGKFLLSDDPETGASDDITLTPAAQFACNSFNGVVYVDLSATGGNNGTSWNDAFTDLQDALLARVICPADVDTILVARGTYYPTPDPLDQDSSFHIPDGLVVLGGFPAGGGNLDERDWNCQETILSGDINQDYVLSGNSFHVVRTKNVSSTTVVDGFTITGGNAKGVSLPDYAGGGWYNDGTGNVSNPTIRNCKFLDNTASDFGGALFNDGIAGESSPVVINCVFSGNTAGVSGGAVFNQGIFGKSSPVLTNCVLSGNNANFGGAMFNNGAVGESAPLLTNCVISGNRADDGGAMYNEGDGGISSPNIVSTIFYNNEAGNAGHVFFNSNGTPLVGFSLFGVDFTTVNHNMGVTDNGNNKFSMDPMFMSARPASAAPTSAGNFRLLSGSPAIDMGDNGANSESEDLDGLARIYNATIDMGAFEWRPYCLQDTVYLDENGEAIVSLETLNLVGELPEFQGCALDTVIDAPSLVTCNDTIVLYSLYLIRDGIDTIIQCTDTIWVRDTLSPVIDMINMELAVNEDCMAVMPDLSIYVSDNCALDTIIQSPEIGEPLGLPGSMVMVTLYARDSSGNESSIEFDFEVVEVAPTVPLNCAGIISPAINPDGTIEVLVKEIAPNANCLAVHDVQVLNNWGGVIWSAKGLRENDFILDGFDLCSYLGRTLEVKISNGLGTCTTILNLDKNGSLVMTSAFQPNDVDPGIGVGKINVYCGKIPLPKTHVPTVRALCGGRTSAPKVQPDWVMPISCSEASDTAEVIFRTWEAYDKEGNLSTLTDTIVVFRLPKLTPGAFVGNAEDSFYCELEAVSNKGEVIKRYTAWKQPVGLHDYELPHSRLQGVTYELPATIIAAGLTNAGLQGPDVFVEYLKCVILRKADGKEVTIGDIVSGDYLFGPDGVVTKATNQQKLYGFLQLLIQLDENPVKVVVNAEVFNFFPYLLLQEGDWVLSEGGNFEKVTSDWFYNGHGNSPFWFSGGWPSIYGNGDCVSYCDIGETGEFGCIRVSVPVLDIETGFSTQLCNTICLDELVGIHCGITITTDGLADWTQTGQGLAGSCTQIRGVDTRITQTCWANTPNWCDGGLITSAYTCDAWKTFLSLGYYFTGSEIRFISGIVEDYECSEKAVEIQLGQWQTLVDTIGPIFDFCYPVTHNLGVGGVMGPIGEQGLDFDDSNYNYWDHVAIQETIRSGSQYKLAKDWEYDNPVIYRVGSHSCEAEVYVPDVRVIDNCSGVHSVKAMVDVKGGNRAVPMELTNTEIRLLGEGDTCIIYTYSHTQDPILIPFNGCDGELVEVRYEAADNCWNQSTWSKFIRITDDVSPTVITNRNLNITLSNKIAWSPAINWDEGSWDNCAIDLRLGRRSDWNTKEAMVDLCADLGPNAPYDNWVDLLDDLGVKRSQAVAAVDGSHVGASSFNTAYNVDDLKIFLNDGEVEQYYFNQIVWLWADEELCGEKVVHAWVYAIASYIAENCSVADEHGNKLRVKDLEAVFDNLMGQPGYGKEMALMGGGWSKTVPFKCVDACEEVPVELLVLDNCCNWDIGKTTMHVEDDGKAKLVRRLPDLDITCEAYNTFYKDIVNNAASLGENGSVSDSTAAFVALDSVFGHYVNTWVDNQNRPTDIDGILLPESELNFAYHSISCSEKSETEKIAVTNHDGSVDWVTRVTKTTYLDTTDHSGTNGIIGINCAASSVQDVWVDLDECGQGTITRRFFISSGCANDVPVLRLEQVINVKSACGMRESMFDLPANVGSKNAPICLPQGLSENYLPDTIGTVTLKSHLEGGLCSSVAIGKEVKELNVLDAPGMKKYIITWNVIDWCASHTSTTREFTYTQEVIATIDPACDLNGGGDDNGDVSLITGHIMTELESPVTGVQVKAIAGNAGPLQVETSSEGDFNFTIARGSQLSIVPNKNTGFSEGVSTADLIDIQRHILQKKALDSKYKKIAADVNGNGMIDGLDVLELRKVVLNPSREFANNTSWRFFDTDTDKEVYQMDNLQGDQTVNFTGVKIGDVNLSGDAASNSRSANGQLHLNIANKVLKGGEIYHVEVRSDNFEDIRGLQYTLNYASAYVSVQSIQPGVLNVTAENYLKYADGIITASWNEADGVSVNADEVLFTIVVKTKSAASLRDVLSLTNNVTPTEAYAGTGDPKKVALHFNSGDSGFALYQNTPNPYKGETVIGFTLPESVAAMVTIYDVTGRMIKRIEGEYEAGYNEVRVTSMELGTTGVLYYQLDTDKYTATKKMIVVN